MIFITLHYKYVCIYKFYLLLSYIFKSYIKSIQNIALPSLDSDIFKLYNFNLLLNIYNNNNLYKILFQKSTY